MNGLFNKQLNRAPNIPDSFDKIIQNILTRVKDFTLPNNLLDGEILNKEIINPNPHGGGGRGRFCPPSDCLLYNFY